MESITDFAPEIQKRISGFVRFLGMESFSRPEVKNISCLLYALHADARYLQIGPIALGPFPPEKGKDVTQ